MVVVQVDPHPLERAPRPRLLLVAEGLDGDLDVGRAEGVLAAAVHRELQGRDRSARGDRAAARCRRPPGPCRARGPRSRPGRPGRDRPRSGSGRSTPRRENAAARRRAPSGGGAARCRRHRERGDRGDCNGAAIWMSWRGTRSTLRGDHTPAVAAVRASATSSFRRYWSIITAAMLPVPMATATCWVIGRRSPAIQTPGTLVSPRWDFGSTCS